MPRWEYRIEQIDTLGKYLAREGYRLSGDKDWGVPPQWEPINDLGASGWEMVSVNWKDDEGVAVFKRELKEFRPKLVALPPEEKTLTEDGEPAAARRGLDAMKRKFRDG